MILFILLLKFSCPGQVKHAIVDPTSCQSQPTNSKSAVSQFSPKDLASNDLINHQLSITLLQHKTIDMAALKSSSRVLIRSLSRSSTASSIPVRALSTSTSLARETAATGAFDSPFTNKGSGTGDRVSKIPDFSKYKSKSGANSNLLFQYFMVGRFASDTTEWMLET